MKEEGFFSNFLKCEARYAIYVYLTLFSEISHTSPLKTFISIDSEWCKIVL